MRDALVIPSKRCLTPSGAFGSLVCKSSMAGWARQADPERMAGCSSAGSGVQIPAFRKRLCFVSLALLWRVVI